MSIHFDTVDLPELDRETDRQNWWNNIAICMHRHANAW